MRRWAVRRRCGATSRRAAADFVLCSRRFRFAARATSPPAASVAGALPPRGQLQPSEALGAEALPLCGQTLAARRIRRRSIAAARATSPPRSKKTIFTQTKSPSARRAQRKAQGAEGKRAQREQGAKRGTPCTQKKRAQRKSGNAALSGRTRCGAKAESESGRSRAAPPACQK
mgnify:CR=1 FL=1